MKGEPAKRFRPLLEGGTLSMKNSPVKDTLAHSRAARIWPLFERSLTLLGFRAQVVPGANNFTVSPWGLQSHLRVRGTEFQTLATAPAI